MKKAILLLMAAMISISAYSTETNNVSSKVVQKEIKSNNLRGLDISHVVEATVHNSNRNIVELTISEELEPYLIFSVSNGIVKIGMDSKRLPRNLQNNMGRFTFKADVYMTKLDKIDASGASSVNFIDSFKINSLEVDISGASKVENLNVSGSIASFDLSGASNVTAVCDVETISYDLSGASKMVVEQKSKRSEVDLSGASKMSFEGRADRIAIDCSGASNVTLKGSADAIFADGSGACSINGNSFVAGKVTVELSGASSMSIEILESLIVEISGSSSLTYSADKDIDIKTISISKGSTLRKR